MEFHPVFCTAKDLMGTLWAKFDFAAAEGARAYRAGGGQDGSLHVRTVVNALVRIVASEPVFVGGRLPGAGGAILYLLKGER